MYTPTVCKTLYPMATGKTRHGTAITCNCVSTARRMSEHDQRQSNNSVPSLESIKINHRLQSRSLRSNGGVGRETTGLRSSGGVGRECCVSWNGRRCSTIYNPNIGCPGPTSYYANVSPNFPTVRMSSFQMQQNNSLNKIPLAYIPSQ